MANMKIQNLGDIKKFSFGEMTSNDSGKTSGTSSAGLYIIFIGGICFFLGCIDKMFLDKSIDIINQSVMFTTIGAALLGVKNIVNGKKPKAKEESTSPEQLNS
jgi:hypothetical protein